MEATELRIGNLIKLYRKIHDKEMTEHKINGIWFIDDRGNFAVELEDGFIINNDIVTLPIPLTEEWLVKLGFDRYGGNWSNEVLELPIVKGITGRDMILSPFNNYALELKFVHQLQNIYHALTGLELTT